MVVTTNPFRSDLICQNQLFKVSYRSFKSLTLFKILKNEGERRNFYFDRQDKSCEKLVKAWELSEKCFCKISVCIEISRSTQQRHLRRKDLKDED